MQTEILETYVILYARRVARGIAFDYGDSEGRTIAVDESDFVEGPTRHGVSGLFPPGCRPWLEQYAAALPEQHGPHRTGRTPLAVFVTGSEASLDRSIVEAATIAGEALTSAFKIKDDLIQTIATPERIWQQIDAFTLPLRVGATTKRAFALLDYAKQREWYRNQPDLGTFGLSYDKVRIGGRTRQPLPDVVLLDSPNELARIEKLDPALWPRLTVALGFEPSSSSPAVAAGSCIVVPGSTEEIRPEFVKNLVYAIIHDQPLHEVLRSAMRQSGAPARAYLIGDPSSVQQLRMSDAMQQLASDLTTLEEQVPTDAFSKPFELAQRLRLDFGQESEALVPMAEVRAAVAQVRSASAGAKKASRSTLRKVDVTMTRTRPQSGLPLFVEQAQTLGIGQRYRVHVRIGRRSRFSLVRGEVLGIDSILPPQPAKSVGHLLHVVLFPLDFTIAGTTIRRLVLPPKGSSKTATFAVVAPQTVGAARLRISVYYDANLAIDSTEDEEAYRNHLIQSFTLDTIVEYYDGWKTDGTIASLEFSRTTAFSEFEPFTRRVGSFAVNESVNGTHALMMKRGGTPASFPLNPILMQKAVDEVRKELFAATAIDPAGQYARFPQGAPENAVAFDDVIRALAKKGRALRQKVFARDSDDVKSILRGVVRAVDKVVQVVRYDPDFYFPWHVLYDFPTPDEITGAPPPPVCKEFRRRNPDGSPFSCAQCLQDCVHPNHDAYCVYGFWGTRLQVEQTLHRPRKEDEPIQKLPIGNESVLVATALTTSTAVGFANDLRTAVGPQWIDELRPPCDLLARLWSTNRPAVLLVLGHYQTKPVAGEVNAPRIQVPGGWLTASRIEESAEDSQWSDPHSIVILAACDSAGQDLLTMNGFVTAFASARAGAFFGTETTVFESLARRFGKSIAQSLFANQTMGQAMLTFRRELLQELNPLGFAFSAYGDADLSRQ